MLKTGEKYVSGAVQVPTVAGGMVVGTTVGGALVEQVIAVSYDEAYKRELRHFHDCVVFDREPLTNGGDGRGDLAFAVNLVRGFGVG